MAPKLCYMVMRINIDCNGCCRRIRRILLKMKVLENHLIDKKQNRVCVYGVFDPAEIAIKIRKKVRRRVEIMEIQELSRNIDDQKHNPGSSQ